MIWVCLTCAVLGGLAGPVFMVKVRNGIRLDRLRALYEFDRLFDMSGKGRSSDVTPAPEPTKPPAKEPAKPLAPTYEFVRARYTSDLPASEDISYEAIRDFDLSNPKLRLYIDRLTWWQLRSSWRLLVASLPLIVLVSYGLFVLFTTGMTDRLAEFARFPAPLLITGSAASPIEAEALMRNVTVVAESAFLGGLLFVLLLFLRALATFDLSPLTVLRGTLYFVAGVVTAVVLYLGLPAIASNDIAPPQVAPPVTSSLVSSVPPAAPVQPPAPKPSPKPGPAAAPRPPATPDRPKPISSLWVIVSFLVGFIPDLAINKMMSGVQRILRIKVTDDRLMAASKSTPLEIIDGIDVLTRFRLQESNIFEVQNLAVSNPVMLFVETPYGIYEVIDWVAQAQLCMAVGSERFLDLQKRSIRTIFDLERSVLSVYSTVQLRRYIAGILLAPTPPLPDDVALKVYADLPGGAAAASMVPAAGFGQATANLFSAAAMASDGKTMSPDPDETLTHLVRTMVDDLHVCRLRQVWQQIMSKIDGTTPSQRYCDRLWDTQWPPRLPSNICHPKP